MACVQEKDDDGRVIKRPMVATRLSESELSSGGYRRLHDDEINDTETGDTKRLIVVDPASDNTQYA